jgi:hypothetical protein
VGRRPRGAPLHPGPVARHCGAVDASTRPSFTAVHVADGKIAKTVFTEVFEPLFCRPSSDKRLKVGHEGLEHRCDHPQVGEVQEDRGDKGPLHQQIPRAPWVGGLGYPLPKLLTITLRVLGRIPHRPQ